MQGTDGPAPAIGQARQGWVGSQLARRLAKLDIRRPADLLLHLPLRYEDETRLIPIARAHDGVPVQVEGEVEARTAEDACRALLPLIADAERVVHALVNGRLTLVLVPVP